MAQQTLENAATFGTQRSKINSNFTELYSTKTDMSDITTAVSAHVAAHVAASDPHGVTYPSTPGGYAVDITGSDLNSLYRTGFYRGYVLVHAPLDDSGYWHILTQSHDANWVKQTATAFGGANATGDIYERVSSSGSWTSWAKVFKGTAIDGTPIGQTTPAAGAFTTLSASGLSVAGSGTFGGTLHTNNSRFVLMDNSIEEHSTNGVASIAVNYLGYGGGIHSRHFDIYNGRSGLLSRFDGENHGLLLGLGIESSTAAGRRLRVIGLHDSAVMQLYSQGGGPGLDPSLDFWASEPSQTYRGCGLGSNVNKHPYYGPRDTGNYGSYIRFREDGFISVGKSLPGETTFTDRPLIDPYGNLVAHSGFYPVFDNNISNGTSSNRWSVVYAATGSINTSDARLKTEISALSPNELNASKQLAKEIGTFKFLDSVLEKGDFARKHIGMTVQRAISIMQDNNLNPFDYAFICYDKWDEETEVVPAVEYKPEVIDNYGDLVQEEIQAKAAYTKVIREAGDRYSFRYDELNQFILAGISARLDALEG